MEYYNNLSLNNIDGEVWKEIQSYPNYYISSFGRVKSFVKNKEGKIVKQWFHGKGYLQVGVTLKNKRITIKTHRLVCLVFNPFNNGKKCINHKNGIKTDNTIENLEWCTNEENIRHAYSLGLCPVGQNHPRARSVMQFDLNGNLIMEFTHIKEATKITGIGTSSIVACCIGDSKMAGKFKWKYKKAVWQ